MLAPATIATLLIAAMVTMDTPPGSWDPTNPEDVARRSTDAPTSGSADDPLKGPDVSEGERGRARGPGSGDGGMQMSPTVAGLLEARCGQCHGPDKQKGGLQIVPVSRLHEGPEKFRVIKPGDAAGSLLVQRIKLPAGHDDAMPPTDQSLSATEIKVIEDWVNAGATQSAAHVKVAGMASAQGARKQTTSPRAFLRAYMALPDLTTAQRKAGIDAATAARKAISAEDKKVLQDFRTMQKAMGDGGELPTEIVARRQEIRGKIQAMEAKARQVQGELWAMLNASQQAAIRTALEQAAAKGPRRPGPNRPNGGGKPPSKP